ncbi:hypothetical protein [Sulfurirhabdus autotrophica]|uniref:Putative membrane protein n=1 Tax=Sulfurirhabdus autotrophica TaxID=1706046 RepID=A0A4R3Y9Y5_9PROT|nr:hypothetical protein [Sulfurirhabdus autotrophica]TCV87474.1 putative membrane protein [Sulfurirhabdus autotrophica]
MMRSIRFLGKLLVIFACLGYPWLAHAAMMDHTAVLLRIILALVPLSVLAFWTIKHATNRILWSFVFLAAAIVIFVLRSNVLLNFDAAFGIPHAAINLFLLWFFGHTLLPGKEPLITRLARRVHGTLDARLVSYTKGVTIAWCVFFIGQIMTSVLLFNFTSLSTWSLFINFINFPLVIVMFIGEYVYRVLRYRDFPHVTIKQTVQAFNTDFSSATGAKPR